MATPRDIRAISEKFLDFLELHKSELIPGLDPIETPGRVGFISFAFRSLMSNFAESKGIEMRKLLPDDYDSDEPLSPETQELLRITEQLLAEEAEKS